MDVEDDEDYLLFTAIAKWFVGQGREEEGGFGGGLDLEEATAATSGADYSRSQRVTLVLLLCFKQLLLLLEEANFRTF